MGKKIVLFSEVEEHLRNEGIEVLFEDSLAEQQGLWFSTEKDREAGEEYKKKLQRNLPLLDLAWRKLTFRQKVILYLTFVKEYRQQDVAKALKVSQPVVSKHLNFALKHLRKIVVGKEVEDDVSKEVRDTGEESPRRV